MIKQAVLKGRLFYIPRLQAYQQGRNLYIKRVDVYHLPFLLDYPDSNQNKQNQNLLCYHYTIVQSK